MRVGQTAGMCPKTVVTYRKQWLILAKMYTFLEFPTQIRTSFDKMARGGKVDKTVIKLVPVVIKLVPVVIKLVPVVVPVVVPVQIVHS